MIQILDNICSLLVQIVLVYLSVLRDDLLQK